MCSYISDPHSTIFARPKRVLRRWGSLDEVDVSREVGIPVDSRHGCVSRPGNGTKLRMVDDAREGLRFPEVGDAKLHEDKRSK